MGSSQSICWVLLFCLILLSGFVAQTHGKMKEQGLPPLRQSKLKPNFGFDTSLFEAVQAVNEDKVYVPQECSKEEDRIERLPGQPQVKFSQYGGYVTVDKAAGRALFYYFAEANNPNKDSLPLLLWLNGGPGCSSLAYGAMQELGPFRVRSDGKTLYANRFSWNYAANLLFLESPAGVGYSYSNTSSDYKTCGDRKTAADNYVFLVNWLERFPEYKNRPFYISGESYAGHYVPQLAHTILYHNKKANKTIINLKGIIIGNAVINEETDNRGMYDYFASHALISDEDAQKINKYCDFSPEAKRQNRECNEATAAAGRDTYYLDIYNIYAPLCTMANYTTPQPKKVSIFNFDPCSDGYVYVYLNRPEVQEALHANVTKLTHDWEPCSDIITDWGDSPSTIIPLLRELMANGLRVWVFSGDIDGRVPFTSTKYSLNKMSLPVKTAWHPWYLNGEVGGYTEVYKGDLTLATIRGAGHQVPSYQPARAFSLIKHFLDGTPLPDTKRY
ncbi:serine carboxypeptidase-like 40 [Juglans microcarpa x Juglans regia]|uniref:serine carboxypeptidase-like 40 n=1 Tax=Juglans microcarpa x Juglans regia TaxID=2249226 RepID=UPI001B7EB58D|nr:serine carboxypeptidase-like 40 [Juglans microcarpa x Juglans regia]